MRLAASPPLPAHQAHPSLPAPTYREHIRNPTDQKTALIGADFEEDGVDWRVLAVGWDAALEDVVVW